MLRVVHECINHRISDQVCGESFISSAHLSRTNQNMRSEYNHEVMAHDCANTHSLLTLDSSDFADSNIAGSRTAAFLPLITSSSGDPPNPACQVG